MLKIGFIDYYLDEWHANNYPEFIKEASAGEMEVAYAYGHIDSPIGGMTTDEWCAKYQIPRCMSIGELIEKSDVLIVLSPDNCEMHEQLCELPLRSGILVAGIIRGRRTLIPTGDDSIQAGDRVVVLAAGAILGDLADILR